MDKADKIPYSFVAVPVEIYEAMLAYELTRSQMKALLYVIRKTFGFKGKASGDYISINQMAKETGISRTSMSRAVSDLEKKGVLDVVRDKGRTSLSFIQVNEPKHWDVPISMSENWWKLVK